MDKHIPKLKSETNSKGKKPKWMTRKVQKIINKKNNLYRKYIISKKQYDLSRYIKCRNESDAEVRKAKSQFEKQIAKDCKSNPKFFWKYVQEKAKQTTGISPLDKGDGVFLNDDIDKADVLNAFFSSVFTREDTNNVPEVEEGTKSKNIYLTDIVITPIAVKDKLKQLNNCKAQGPDGIPPRVLKEVSENLAIPLSILFNKSLEKGLIPADWKQAEVVAVFTKGTKSDPGNYRPVSLTSVICKVLESFVRDAIVKHMNDHNLYANCQHGFRKKRSCATQLLEVMEILTDHIDQREPTDMVYLDFRKAFDSVPHERLLSKLMMYGITGGVHSWVKGFLYDRTQRVRVGKKLSSSADVLSGIPQGSILGPVLFTIFINDIADNINSFCRIFADDTKIFNITKNSITLQEDLAKLQEWSFKWGLHFNVNKCHVLHIGYNNPRYKYILKSGEDESVLNICLEEKDLGVIFDGKLSFDAHIQNCISKANRILGIIKRSFSYLDKELFLLIYKSMVRPHLEYANSIWSPKLKRQSAAIERVQRRATKLYEIRQWSYERRLKFLNLPSLKYRRYRGDLIQTYKIIHKIDDLKTEDFFTIRNDTNTRSKNVNFYIEKCSSNSKLHSFSYRSRRYWNSLSKITKEARDLNSFKNLLDKDPNRFISYYEYDN